MLTTIDHEFAEVVVCLHEMHSKMKTEYETEIVANVQHWVLMGARYAFSCKISVCVSEIKYRKFMLHICNTGLNRVKLNSLNRNYVIRIASSKF